MVYNNIDTIYKDVYNTLKLDLASSHQQKLVQPLLRLDCSSKAFERPNDGARDQVSLGIVLVTLFSV